MRALGTSGSPRDLDTTGVRDANVTSPISSKSDIVRRQILLGILWKGQVDPVDAPVIEIYYRSHNSLTKVRKKKTSRENIFETDTSEGTENSRLHGEGKRGSRDSRNGPGTSAGEEIVKRARAAKIFSRVPA